MLDTIHQLKKIPFPQIRREKLETLQVNLGYKCNQQCQHCHVNAGPNRTEMMNDEVIEQIKKFILEQQINVLDITGGAPELHHKFRELASWASENNLRVIDRCNLTILFEPGQEDLAEFLAAKQIEVVASMPCYLEQNVDKQRGKGVFDKSIKALRMLNAAGYGKDDHNLTLNLVYNPQGPHLPPPQNQLELGYKKYLRENYGIDFNQLLVITNLPIARFGSALLSRGEFDDYMCLLKTSYNEANLANVMCKNLISVDWQGRVFDCDFNQMLDLPCATDADKVTTISDLNNGAKLNREITVAGHCYACVSGQGSSCSGALS